MVFCNVLLDCLFARCCLIKLLSKCCLNCYVAFSFKKFFYNKNSFFFWYLRDCYHESTLENFWIFSQAICPPSYLIMTPWNSLLVFQFPYYLINKTTVFSNQQVVKLYENSNLVFMWPAEIFPKIKFNAGLVFSETPCILCVSLPVILPMNQLYKTSNSHTYKILWNLQILTSASPLQ